MGDDAANGGDLNKALCIGLICGAAYGVASNVVDYCIKSSISNSHQKDENVSFSSSEDGLTKPPAATSCSSCSNNSGNDAVTSAKKASAATTGTHAPTTTASATNSAPESNHSYDNSTNSSIDGLTKPPAATICSSCHSNSGNDAVNSAKKASAATTGTHAPTTTASATYSAPESNNNSYDKDASSIALSDKFETSKSEEAGKKAACSFISRLCSNPLSSIVTDTSRCLDLLPDFCKNGPDAAKRIKEEEEARKDGPKRIPCAILPVIYEHCYRDHSPLGRCDAYYSRKMKQCHKQASEDGVADSTLEISDITKLLKPFKHCMRESYSDEQYMNCWEIYGEYLKSFK